ncbi:MAG TPA: TIGR03936 family radical SAM-associated protein [Actinomycetes bacterium]|nr:TIGR03936 family radical SAM-associated protein [Actinomycetes bacterium]
MARRTPDREYVAPVQKLRIRYAKRGRLRFASHRDFQRALERALRRAAVPMAYSAGFSPHPKISYANAAPTGSASEAEYLEIGVSAQLDPAKVARALDEALPPGLDILEVVEAGPGSLTDRLVASEWLIRMPQQEPAAAVAAVELLLASTEATVQRMTKSGLRTFDVRPALVRLAVEADAGGDDGPCAILRVVVRHTVPAVRPDDVLSALDVVAGLTPPVAPRVTRLAQGPLDEDTGTVADPLAADRSRGEGADGA